MTIYYVVLHITIIIEHLDIELIQAANQVLNTKSFHVEGQKLFRGQCHASPSFFNKKTSILERKKSDFFFITGASLEVRQPSICLRQILRL